MDPTPEPPPADRRPGLDPRVVVATAVVVAAGLRALLWPWRSGDYDWGWRLWYERLVVDGFAAFAEPFYDYNPPWPMIVWALTWLDGWSHGLLRDFNERMLLVKAAAMSFDLVAAFLVARLVREIHPGGRRPLYAGCAVLLAPTVVMNAGMVVQCDGMYVSFILAAVLATLRASSLGAWAAFGASVAFKLQAIFVAPFLVAATLRGRIALWPVVLVPAIWLASLVPIWLVGRPWLDLVLIYATQSATFGDLAPHAPNIWFLVDNKFHGLGYGLGLVLAASGVLVYVRVVQTARVPLDAEALLLAALVSCAISPFLLPKMHDRYFFAADLLAIALAFANPAYAVAAAAMQVASSFAYMPYSLSFTTHLQAGLINAVTVPWLALRLVARLHPAVAPRLAGLLAPASLARALAALALAFALWNFALAALAAGGRDLAGVFGVDAADIPGFLAFLALWALALPAINAAMRRLPAALGVAAPAR